MGTDDRNVGIFITTTAGEEAHTPATILLQHRKVRIDRGVSWRSYEYARR